jgi:NADH dehydrogenase FAD-containing subunit
VIPLPGRHHRDVPLMLPKAGVFAHAQGEAVAANIVAELQTSSHLTGLAPMDRMG